MEKLQDAEIVELYERMRRSRTLSRRTVARWWCQKQHCHLGTAFDVNGRLVMFLPPYTLAPGRLEETSTESGRAANMIDDKKWRARGVDLTSMLAFGKGLEDNVGVDVNCRHASRLVTVRSLLEALNDVQPGASKNVTI